MVLRVTAHKLFSNIYGLLCKHGRDQGQQIISPSHTLATHKPLTFAKSTTSTTSCSPRMSKRCGPRSKNKNMAPSNRIGSTPNCGRHSFHTNEVDVKRWSPLSWRAYLGDEMGLGKTYQALFFLHYYRQNKRALLICPSYLRYHWAHEIEHWFGWEAQVVLKDAMNSPGASSLFL